MRSLKLLMVTALFFFAAGIMARDEYIILKKDGQITLTKKGVNIHVDTLGELVDSLGLVAKYGLEYTDISALYVTGKMTVDSSTEWTYSKTGLFTQSTTTKSLLEINEGKVSKIAAAPVMTKWKIEWGSIILWMIVLLSGVFLRSELAKRSEKITFSIVLCIGFILVFFNGQYTLMFMRILSGIYLISVVVSWFIGLRDNSPSAALFLLTLSIGVITLLCITEKLWLPYAIAWGLLGFGILSRYLHDRMKEPVPRYESDISDR